MEQLSDLEDIDVLGIGNAIVDVFATPDDESLIAAMDLEKGTMALIDHEKSEYLYKCLQSSSPISGGTVANTINGLRSFGANAAFIGKVGQDISGERFVLNMKEKGIICSVQRCQERTTSTSYVIVTPDGARTMCTYIDKDCIVTREDIDESLIDRTKVIYLSGYMLDSDEGKETAQYIMEMAHEKGKKIAMTLADAKCVARHKSAFAVLLEHYLDFLFANTQEINALFDQTDVNQSLKRLKDISKGNKDAVYAVTLGKEGSAMISGGGIVKVAGQEVASVVDKTGAGSAFASAVLYGCINGYSMEKSAELGNKAAVWVLSQLGARPKKEFVCLLNSMDEDFGELNQSSTAS